VAGAAGGAVSGGIGGAINGFISAAFSDGAGDALKNGAISGAIAGPFGGVGAGIAGGLGVGAATGSAAGSVARTACSSADDVIVAGEQATAHGAVRLADPTRFLTTAEKAATKASHTLKAKDGATVYLHQAGPGKFNVVIEGERGLITQFRHMTPASVRRLAINYGWTAP
jgi:hypothetical protein